MENKRYFKKMLENPLPPLKEDERIYLNVPFNKKFSLGLDQLSNTRSGRKNYVYTFIYTQAHVIVHTYKDNHKYCPIFSITVRKMLMLFLVGLSSSSCP